MNFKDLGLGEKIVRALESSGYTEPSDIQKKAIPEILAGHDVIACAQTGTGKTAAFALPLIDKIASKSMAWRKPTVLILSPTRELACQIADNIQKYSKNVPVRTAVIYGGVSKESQIKLMRKGVQILVATPGRLLDHIKERNIDLRTITTLVLDEADRMLDMGFIRDVKKIAKLIRNDSRQTLLFSATYSPQIRSLSREFLNRPKIIKVTRDNTPVKEISQVIYSVAKNDRRKLLCHLISKQEMKQVLVFARTKRGAERLAKQLVNDGYKTLAIHGDKAQSTRQKALDSFKNNEISILVATDVAARGIDIARLPYVVNYDLPQDPENYVHRIGRTGRAGMVGEAISFYSEGDARVLRAIEVMLSMRFTRKDAPGLEAK